MSRGDGRAESKSTTRFSAHMPQRFARRVDPAGLDPVAATAGRIGPPLRHLAQKTEEKIVRSYKAPGDFSGTLAPEWAAAVPAT